MNECWEVIDVFYLVFIFCFLMFKVANSRAQFPAVDDEELAIRNKFIQQTLSKLNGKNSSIFSFQYKSNHAFRRIESVATSC